MGHDDFPMRQRPDEMPIRESFQEAAVPKLYCRHIWSSGRSSSALAELVPPIYFGSTHAANRQIEGQGDPAQPTKDTRDVGSALQLSLGPAKSARTRVASGSLL